MQWRWELLARADTLAGNGTVRCPIGAVVGACADGRTYAAPKQSMVSGLCCWERPNAAFRAQR